MRIYPMIGLFIERPKMATFPMLGHYVPELPIQPVLHSRESAIAELRQYDYTLESTRLRAIEYKEIMNQISLVLDMSAMQKIQDESRVMFSDLEKLALKRSCLLMCMEFSDFMQQCEDEGINTTLAKN